MRSMLQYPDEEDEGKDGDEPAFTQCSCQALSVSHGESSGHRRVSALEGLIVQ